MSIRSTSLALSFALLASICLATTVVPMSIEKMTAASSDVVEARAIDARSAWNPQRTLIHTYTRFEVRRTLKGTAPNVITVKQLGGQADGYSQRVSGVQQFQPGDEAVLFLTPSASNDGTLVVTGMIQGSFKMSRLPSGEVVVSNGVPEVNAFDRHTRETEVFRGARMTLRQLENRVRKAMGE